MPKLPAMFNLKDTNWRKILPTFLVHAFFLITLLALLISLHTREIMHNNLHLVLHEEQGQMHFTESLLHQELARLSRNILTFTTTPVILRFFVNPSDQAARQLINAGLSNFIKDKDGLEQARIVDNNGRELVRVEMKDQQISIIPVEELATGSTNVLSDQDPRLQLQGKITFTPVDLARNQKGEIMHPFHPLLRLATPIFDPQNHKVGILQFTYQVQQFFDLFSKTISHRHRSDDQFRCTPQIVNDQGYWLLAPDKEDEWGFLHDPQRRFDRRFPDVWADMLARRHGQIQTKDGLFTFIILPLAPDIGRSKDTGELHPAALNRKVQQDRVPFWILISQVYPLELTRLNTDTIRFHLILFLCILAASLPLLWWVNLLLKGKEEDKNQILNELKQTNHLSILLQTIIQLHRLIDQEKEKQSLVKGCCDILVTSRGYASAWIILLNQEGKVEISAQSGLRHDFDQLERQINLGNPPFCVRTCVMQQGLATISAPDVFCADCSIANGYPGNGIMCAALVHEASIYGYLNISLPLDLIQDQKEKSRFREIARDIGYALFNLEQREKKIEAERSLHQSEERLRNITDSAQDAILMVNSKGAISFWNPAAERIFGYLAEEALGKELQSLLLPLRYREAHLAAFREFVHNGCGGVIGKTVEMAALRKDGREIPVTLSLSAIFQDGAWHAVGILRDMTEHKIMVERIMQSEKMATIAGLAAGVAHEINTPLSAILQSIQVIRQSLDPELARNQEIAGRCGLDLTRANNYFQEREINFFMDGIRESAIKAGKIITNLLQFSRPQKLEFAREDLAQLLDKSLELAKNDYNLKKCCDILNIEIIKEYTPNLPPVLCVAMEIEQVFINLLKNAAQAMGDQPEPRPKPRITLRTGQQGKMVRVEITDNGPGIDEETIHHIFDPFFTTKDIGMGTGLGLSVSYTIIVTKHGGQLSVQSKPGQGATFAIDLPINRERQE